MVNPFCARTRDYKTNKKTPHRNRKPFHKNEKAAIIILRHRFKHSLQHIADITDRSLSTIHKITSNATSPKTSQGGRERFYSKHAKRWSYKKRNWVFDLRKLPKRIRELDAETSRHFIGFDISRWFPFIKGEEAEPP